MGAGRLGRDLLSDHHSHGEFLLVDGSRDPLPWRLGHHRGECGVGAQHVDRRLGVRIQIEEAPASCDRGGEIAEVVQHQVAQDVVGMRCEAGDSVTRRQPHRAAIRSVANLLDARHRRRREVTEQPLEGERRPHRQPHGQHPRPARRAAAELRLGANAQLGGRQRTDLAHGVVELADAREARGERDIAERQVGRLDEYPRGFGALSPCQRQRVRAHLGLQQTLELTRRVADTGRQPGHALAVDGAVGDQPHGAGDDVTPDVPFRRAGGCVGSASLTGPEAGPLRGRGGGVEADIACERWPRRTAGPAVDTGGVHRGDEPPVEPRVLRLDRAIAAVEVLVHTSTMARRPDDD